MSHNRPLVNIPSTPSTMTPAQQAQEQAKLAWLADQVAEAMLAYRDK